MNRRVVGRLIALTAVGGVLLLVMSSGCGGHRTGDVSATDTNTPDGPDILLMDDEGLVPEEKLAELSGADGDKAPDVTDYTPLEIGWELGKFNELTVQVGKRLARRFWTKKNFVYMVELTGVYLGDDPELTLCRQWEGKWRRSALVARYPDTLLFKSTQKGWMWVKVYASYADDGATCHALLRIGHRDMTNLTPPTWAG